jgi:hypothetical protein
MGPTVGEQMNVKTSNKYPPAQDEVFASENPRPPTVVRIVEFSNRPPKI